MSDSVFLDSNAGAPLHPLVVTALRDFLGDEAASLGNASSQHAFGRRAAALADRAKEAILRTLGADPKRYDLLFTSGGAEANALAIQSCLQAGEIWAVSPLEHPSVLEQIEPMRKRGVEVHVLKADASGEVTVDKAVQDRARLLSKMRANNETGLIASHIQSRASSSSTLIHADCVAAWGKTEIDLSLDGAPDLITIAGHKLGALSGIGALVFKRELPIRRAGTQNLLGIYSMLVLAENWSRVREEVGHLTQLRDGFEKALKTRFRSVRITGEGRERVPHLSHFYFTGFPKPLSLVAALDLRGFAVSAGAACASAVPRPSHVLLAMGVGEVDASNALRVSLHPGNTEEDLSGLLDALSAIIGRYETA